jgi:heptosyltransferase-2
LGPTATGLAGRTTLRETAAVLERCRLYVGNDSGPLHLAAAGGVPCVEISCHPATGRPDHENSPDRFGPWGVPHVVLRAASPRAPCDGYCGAQAPHCILEVDVDAVVAAADSLLAPAATVQATR